MAERVRRSLAREHEILPIIITIAASAGVCLFIFMNKTIGERVGPGVFNATYHFLLVVVLGSGVSVLFQKIAYAREARERRRTLQREIHDALVTGYNDAKRARRLLRARARSGTADDTTFLAAEYDAQLEALSSAQLAIELATRRIELNRDNFFGAEELLRALKTVAAYLNTVVDEWEDTRPGADGTHEPLGITTLPRLAAFILPWRKSPEFRDGFKLPFDDALRLLEKALTVDP